MKETSKVILLLTATCTGLMAGLFYSYSCSVVPALKLLGDHEYVAVMQSINKAIQNPVFFMCFFGALLLLPGSTYLSYSPSPSLIFRLLLASTVVYFIGAFGVTAFGNIPLNNELEKFNLTNASADAIRLQRTAFENKWDNLNLIRTVSSTLSFALVVMACIHSGKGGGS